MARRQRTLTSGAPSSNRGVRKLGVVKTPQLHTPVRLVGGPELKVLNGRPDERIAAVAGAQHGQISHAQLLALGLTPQMIKTRDRRGSLFRVHRGVYAVGSRAAIDLGSETAALLAVGAPVALSLDSAGWQWRIWPEPPDDDVVHVSVPGHRAKSRGRITVHHSLSVGARDVTILHGLPITTPTRTVLDLADRYRDIPRTVERVLDEALARHLTSPTKLRAALAGSPGRSGAPLLVALLDPERARGVTREAAEERLLGHFRRANIPDPERNVGLGRFTVDFYWAGAQLAVEFDSFTWHTGAAAFRRDREKDAYLRDRGVELHRVTWTMLEDPVPLIARIVRAIATRSGWPDHS